MLRIGIAFLVGNCAVQCLPGLPAASWSWLLLLPVLAAVILRSPSLAAAVLGAAWAWASAATQLSHDLAPELEGESLDVTGFVRSLPSRSADSVAFDFDVERVEGVPFPERFPERLRLGWYDTAPPLASGQRWRLQVHLQRRHSYANPGGYDYEGQLFRLGIGATGYVLGGELQEASRWASMPYAILSTRAWLAERIEVAAHDHEMRGVLRGLAVGDTGAISPEQWKVFSATGTTHLLAISGLHISMVAMLFAWLGGRLTRTSFGQRRRWTRLYGETLGGLTGAIGYSLLAGLSTPTERTLAMLCIFFLSRALRRNSSVGHTIGLTLVAVLLIDPFAPLSVGAWLSFGAVVAIVSATSGMLFPAGMLATFARTQWAVTIGMLPIIALAFGSLSLVSPLANALAVPLFTIVLVPLILLGALIATLSPPLGSPILGFAASVLEWCWPVLDWLSHLGVAVWHFPALSWPPVAALGIGAALALLPGPRLARFAGCALCAPAFFAPAATLKPGEFSVSMLDVGQGLAMVVRTSTHALVYDAGPKFRSGRDTGELVVVPYLHSVGLSALDLFIASHGDQDHVGGARSLFEQVRVNAVLAGPSAKDLRRDARLCIQGGEWEWDGVRFRVLSPGAELAERDNDSSCVVSIVGVGGRVLLTGDIEKTAETLLLDAPLNVEKYLEAGVVTMPHHGSKTSSTPEFVTAAHARYALASAGYRNRWGFPKPEVAARWQASGAVTYCTSGSGAIEIDVLVRGIQPPREYRIEHPRYWRARQGVSIRGK